MKRLLSAICETVATADPEIQQIDIFVNQLKKNHNYPIQSSFAFIDIKTTGSVDMGYGRREETASVAIHIGKTLVESTEYGAQGAGAGLEIIDGIEAVKAAVLQMEASFISVVLDKGFQFEDRYATTAVYEMKFEFTYWTGV